MKRPGADPEQAAPPPDTAATVSKRAGRHVPEEVVVSPDISEHVDSKKDKTDGVVLATSV